MEENQPKTGKYALNFGLILGVISVIFGIMLYTLDMHYQRNTAVTIVGVLITVVVLFFAINQFKKNNDGFLTLSEALKVGVGAALIAAIIGVVYQYALANYIDPNFMDKAMDAQMAEAMANGKMTSEQVEQGKEMGKKFFWVGYPIYLIVSVLFGLIISLVIGLIIKKNKPE
ncbi:MAG: DUF4199 domain-containing protein [Maribacter sp.]|nr:DUF4199 domain-containing protein [Maribacter sp.]